MEATLSSSDVKRAKRRKSKKGGRGLQYHISEIVGVTSDGLPRMRNEDSQVVEEIQRLMDADGSVTVPDVDTTGGPNLYLDTERCLLCRCERHEQVGIASISIGDGDCEQDEDKDASVTQLPLWVCPDCTKTVEEEQRRGIFEPPVIDYIPMQRELPSLPLTGSITEPEKPATSSTCECEACIEKRAIEAEQVQEQLELRNYWIEFKRAIHQVYRECGLAIGETLIKQQVMPVNPGPVPNTDHLKQLVHRLCVNDPHRLYQCIEAQVQLFIVEMRLRLLHHMVASGSSQQSKPFVRVMLEEYAKLCSASKQLSPILQELDTKHLKHFNLTWELVNRHLFHSIVYMDPTLHNGLSDIFSQQRLGNSTWDKCQHETYSTILKFDDEMTVISVLWREAQQLLDEYTQEQVVAKAKHRVLRKDWELFNAHWKLMEEELLSKSPSLYHLHRCPCEECCMPRQVTVSSYPPSLLTPAELVSMAEHADSTQSPVSSGNSSNTSSCNNHNSHGCTSPRSPIVKTVSVPCSSSPTSTVTWPPTSLHATSPHFLPKEGCHFSTPPNVVTSTETTQSPGELSMSRTVASLSVECRTTTGLHHDSACGTHSAVAPPSLLCSTLSSGCASIDSAPEGQHCCQNCQNCKKDDVSCHGMSICVNMPLMPQSPSSLQTPNLPDQTINLTDEKKVGANGEVVAGDLLVSKKGTTEAKPCECHACTQLKDHLSATNGPHSPPLKTSALPLPLFPPISDSSQNSSHNLKSLIHPHLYNLHTGKASLTSLQSPKSSQPWSINLDVEAQEVLQEQLYLATYGEWDCSLADDPSLLMHRKYGGQLGNDMYLIPPVVSSNSTVQTNALTPAFPLVSESTTSGSNLGTLQLHNTLETCSHDSALSTGVVSLPSPPHSPVKTSVSRSPHNGDIYCSGQNQSVNSGVNCSNKVGSLNLGTLPTKLSSTVSAKKDQQVATTGTSAVVTSTASSPCSLPNSRHNHSGLNSPNFCGDPDCEGHLPEGEESVDDSCSERSSSTSTSNQRESRVCDCCYCEVFGHGVPAVAPVSRNYPEMRERLRLRLSKRKPEDVLPTKRQGQGKSEPMVDERGLDELLSYINGTDGTSHAISKLTTVKPAKRQKKKVKKVDGDKNSKEPSVNSHHEMEAVTALATRVSKCTPPRCLPSEAHQEVGLAACTKANGVISATDLIPKYRVVAEVQTRLLAPSHKAKKDSIRNESATAKVCTKSVQVVPKDRSKNSSKTYPSVLKSTSKTVSKSVTSIIVNQNQNCSVRNPAVTPTTESVIFTNGRPSNRNTTQNNNKVKGKENYMIKSHQPSSKVITSGKATLVKEQAAEEFSPLQYHSKVKSQMENRKQLPVVNSETSYNKSRSSTHGGSQVGVKLSTRSKKNKKKKNSVDDTTSPDDVFMPKDIDLENGDLDEIERELEAFKRFCFNSVPPERKEKVHVNLKDIIIKKRPNSGHGVPFNGSSIQIQKQ